MDAILHRMLAVEEEARDMIRAAEEEAAHTHDRTRLEAVRIEEHTQQDISREAEELIASRVAAAEAAKRQALEAAAPRLDQFQKRLHDRLQATMPTVVDILGFPNRARSRQTGA